MSDEEELDFEEPEETQKKGRGHDEARDDFRYAGKSGQFEGLDDDIESGVQKSIEGYVLIVTNLHEETAEEDLTQHFSEFGVITDLRFALDRRSGYAKGYALIEYKTRTEAETAIKEGHESELCEQMINVNWAFLPTK